LERFGGTVEKFVGDAVVAVFGAPVVHEDDPERAALAIRDWAREEERIQVRIAVNTGEALIILGARPAEGEGMAAGDVVNTAARLQVAAPVNGILVGQRTFRATRQAIEYREVAPVAAKGKREPVGAQINPAHPSDSLSAAAAGFLAFRRPAPHVESGRSAGWSRDRLCRAPRPPRARLGPASGCRPPLPPVTLAGRPRRYQGLLGLARPGPADDN